MKNNKHSELVEKYKKIKGIYNHFRLSILLEKDRVGIFMTTPELCIDTEEKLSESKALIGSYREVVNNYSKMLRKLKKEIQQCQKKYQKKENAVNKP